MIENRNPSKPTQKLELVGQIAAIQTTKIYFGTKVKYSIIISTLDPNALMLGALKATEQIKLTVETISDPKKANEEQQFQ